jgi:two-component system cell cycle sensor histidine kinase/response regulator CckA
MDAITDRPLQVSGDAHPGTVLVVDDDDDVRRSISRVLRAHGYRALAASNAAQARAMVESDEPDLMLIDMVMPGLEGREAASLMQAHHPNLPVLYMSGYTNEDVVRVPVGAFLRKPFTIGELLDRVRTALV